jgi:hypothetical protein
VEVHWPEDTGLNWLKISTTHNNHLILRITMVNSRLRSQDYLSLTNNQIHRVSCMLKMAENVERYIYKTALKETIDK